MKTNIGTIIIGLGLILIGLAGFWGISAWNRSIENQARRDCAQISGHREISTDELGKTREDWFTLDDRYLNCLLEKGLSTPAPIQNI